MSTATVARTNRPNFSGTLPGRRYDHLFFSITALLILITVVVGFAPSYYLAGLYRAPVPSPIIHFHAAAFTCWILLLVTQTSLVSAGRVDIHRRLGIAGFLLACAMVVLGLLAATNALVRGFGPRGGDPKAFFVTPVTDMLVFSVLVAAAVYQRRNAMAHKRIIFGATVALMTAPIARWHFALVHHNARHAELFSYLFLLFLLIYDLWSLRKVHRATLLASGFLVFMQEISVHIGRTAAWHTFASWVQSLAS
jgi:hypothetical protein